MLHTKYQSSMPSSFRKEDFQGFCYFFSFWLPWQPELWVEFNLLNTFCRASPKEHPCQVSSRLAQWFRRRRCLKKLWTTHDRHWAITKAHHEHFVLRLAKNVLIELRLIRMLQSSSIIKHEKYSLLRVVV